MIAIIFPGPSGFAVDVRSDPYFIGVGVSSIRPPGDGDTITTRFVNQRMNGYSLAQGVLRRALVQVRPVDPDREPAPVPDVEVSHPLAVILAVLRDPLDDRHQIMSGERTSGRCWLNEKWSAASSG